MDQTELFYRTNTVKRTSNGTYLLALYGSSHSPQLLLSVLLFTDDIVLPSKRVVRQPKENKMVGLSTDNGSNRGAALLLMKVRMLAMDEIRKSPTPHISQSVIVCPETTSRLPAGSIPEPSQAQWRGRTRTVSICSQNEVERKSHSHNIFPSSEELQVEPSAFLLSHDQERSSWGRGNSALLSSRNGSNRKQKFVGEIVHGSVVKATLRKKFSWKNYPELEQYLVDHRAEYMQYSSQLNYTAEQKQYNNDLTHGLLSIAAEAGYRFEDFTFAAIRDRIRCYYKSFVQASKKRIRRRTK